MDSFFFPIFHKANNNDIFTPDFANMRKQLYTFKHMFGGMCIGELLSFLLIVS